MKKVNQESFSSFVRSGKKVVEFSADWCIDCKRIAPDLPEIEKRFDTKLAFAELDVDESRTIAEQYHVKGIPTFILFDQGEEVGRLPSRDAKTKEQVIAFLDQKTQEG